MALSTEQKKALSSVAIGLVGCYLAYRFGPNPLVKSAAVSVGAVILAGQVPLIQGAIQAPYVFATAA